MHFSSHLFAFFFYFYFFFVCSLSLSLSLFVHCYTMHQHHTHQPFIPCLYCHPQRYIRMVQNLIERCLILHMSQDQCVKALAEHARITPLVTLTVWKELQKENKDFFRAYFQVISPRPFTRKRPESSLYPFSLYRLSEAYEHVER
ncbi:uncharacterized protein LOC129310958 isoform X2 [Prosopis cineraria]|uniref:uncharacterized protein LOC129310958 isoform X2 n=1 Tax=Prosopis cineraria TaxID=364024 RepID=UPI0024102DB1|nr:uncharacterized protein LOC129310958 isoform X2 [Prosopis cineraria]